MSLDVTDIAEIQNMINEAIAAIVRKRIPDLNDYSLFGELTLLDQMAVYMQGVDKTAHVDMLTLKALLTTGGTGEIAPVFTGDEIVHIVTAEEAGGNTVLLPELAGKTFFLRLEGWPVWPDYQMLNAGGWKMTTPDYQLQEGQKFDARVYELQTSSGAPASLSSSFFAGDVLINASGALNALNDVNKLIKVRAGATKITLTLPDLLAVGENAFIALEAVFGNTYQTTIQTAGGQQIYMNNAGYSTLYLGKGETIFLYRGSDGWYCLFDYPSIVKQIGKPFFCHAVDNDQNEMLFDGRVLNRGDYPRLWREVQKMGAGLITEATWQTAQVYLKGGVYYGAPPAAPYETILRPFRGKWSSGDGATTFRVPDLRGMFLRSLKEAADTERYADETGVYQNESVRINADVKGVKTLGPGTIANTVDVTVGQPDITQGYPIYTGSTSETRPENIGLHLAFKY